MCNLRIQEEKRQLPVFAGMLNSDVTTELMLFKSSLRQFWEIFSNKKSFVVQLDNMSLRYNVALGFLWLLIGPCGLFGYLVNVAKICLRKPTVEETGLSRPHYSMSCGSISMR